MKSFLELTKERYSVREYLPKDVEQEKLEYVMESAYGWHGSCAEKGFAGAAEKERKADAEKGLRGA